MLCPKCLKNRNDVKLKTIESRPDGPFRRLRHYKCPVCKFDVWNPEELLIDTMTLKFKTYPT